MAKLNLHNLVFYFSLTICFSLDNVSKFDVIIDTPTISHMMPSEKSSFKRFSLTAYKFCVVVLGKAISHSTLFYCVFALSISFACNNIQPLLPTWDESDM